MAILREHLIEKVAISEVCQKHGVQPTLFYTWQLFEEGAVVFEQPRARSGRQAAAEQRKIEALEARIRNKDEVLAELPGEHVAHDNTVRLHTGRLNAGAGCGRGARAPGSGRHQARPVMAATAACSATCSTQLSPSVRLWAAVLSSAPSLRTPIFM